MKVNELMIGDWVFDGDKVARVTSLTCDGIIETTRRISNIEIVAPIPLTGEILEKNFPEIEGFGFDLAWGKSSVTINDEHCLWHLDIDGSLMGICGEFRYVHELQRALKLCNIDKEIVL